MASVVLSVVGGAIGGPAGAAIGSVIGAVIDSRLVAALTPTQRIEGPRLDNIRVTTATEGIVIPRVHGRMRVGGNIIWATDFREEKQTQKSGGGKGGGGGGTKTTEYLYFASFAVALCEGPIAGIGRIWTDGKPFDIEGVVWRVHKGTETQAPDSLIENTMGTGNAPAYRGLAYIVFDDLPLEKFGNRIPQLSFEVFRLIDDPEGAEQVVKAVALIPAAGEFVYATEKILRSSNGTTTPENVNSTDGRPDLLVSLDQLEAAAPNLESVSLVVSWFGTDLRCGQCLIQPGVETLTKSTTPKSWSVNGVARANGHLISQVSGEPAFGGTPADFAVVEAIRELKARGLRVTFYPFLLMDVPEGNALPNPYSDNAGTIGQARYPWRGRITCSPAAGFVGSVDKTPAASSQVDAFFGTAAASDISVSVNAATNAVTASYSGPAEWSYRRMVLHYARLCAAINAADPGTVDAFLIGSELRGLTQVRSGASTYPAVAKLQTLAADVKAILGISVKVGYAADWSEYFGHQPQDGSGDVFFHLDPLWSDANIDFVGIDNYMPLADWRDPGSGAGAGSFAHADALAGWRSIYDRDYLEANIEGGEGFDWYYASQADRDAQVRTTITDGTYGKPWVFRFKDIRDWWSNVHYDRPGGKQNNLLPDSDNPQSANWTATGATKTGIGGTHLNYFTLAADVASGGGVLHRVARSTAAVVASGSYRVTWLFKAGTSGKRYLRLACSGNSLEISGAIGAVPSYTNSGFTYSNFIEADLGGGYWRAQVDVITGAAAALAVQIGPNSGTAGQTITFVGGDVVRLDATSAASTGWVPKSKPIRFTEAGCPAVDKGANQPNVFVDPKSSESQYPYYSKGNRDDAIQRRAIEAVHHYWNANNPVGGTYGGPMLDMGELAVWCWDARPYPAFPGRSDVWGDYQNWQYGHWLTGRLGASSLSALVRELCVRGGLAESDIDAGQLSATVPGYVITALESARGSIEPLARFYGFDATESAGLIRFVPRGTTPVVTITADDLAIRSRADEDIELVRAQETELPLALKWRCLRMDEDYGGMTVEARRITVDTARVTSESFAIATAGAEADMRCRRALVEAWVQRETAKLQLPPSRLALDPADVVLIEHDGRQLEFRLAAIADQDARIIEALRTDAVIYGARPGPERVPNLPKPVVYGPPVVALMDLPILDEEVPDHRPFAAVFASPWYGQAAVYRSPAEDGFVLLDVLGRPARMGSLAFDFHGGPASRFDLGNQLYVDLLSGTLASVSDLDLFAGNNSLAIESSAGVWEIVQFASAELVATNRYRLTRLLRGQRGTEGAIGNPAPAGSSVVVLDDAIAPLSIASTDLNLAYNWRIGPASKDPADLTYVQLAFTPKGIGRRPYSVAHVSQPWKFARTPGDLTISWKRRTRAVAGDSWEAIEVPLFEESEAYEVDILDGATIKRTLASNTTSVVYAGAQQIADWGALLVPGNSLQVAIYQLSAQFGRGARKLETLYF